MDDQVDTKKPRLAAEDNGLPDTNTEPEKVPEKPAEKIPADLEESLFHDLKQELEKGVQFGAKQHKILMTDILEKHFLTEREIRQLHDDHLTLVLQAFEYSFVDIDPQNSPHENVRKEFENQLTALKTAINGQIVFYVRKHELFVENLSKKAKICTSMAESVYENLMEEAIKNGEITLQNKEQLHMEFYEKTVKEFRTQMENNGFEKPEDWQWALDDTVMERYQEFGLQIPNSQDEPPMTPTDPPAVLNDDNPDDPLLIPNDTQNPKADIVQSPDLPPKPIDPQSEQIDPSNGLTETHPSDFQQETNLQEESNQNDPSEKSPDLGHNSSDIQETDIGSKDKGPDDTTHPVKLLETCLDDDESQADLEERSKEEEETVALTKDSEISDTENVQVDLSIVMVDEKIVPEGPSSSTVVTMTLVSSPPEVKVSSAERTGDSPRASTSFDVAIGEVELRQRPSSSRTVQPNTADQGEIGRQEEEKSKAVMKRTPSIFRRTFNWFRKLLPKSRRRRV